VFPKPGEWLSAGGGPALNLLFLWTGPLEGVDFRVPRPQLAVSDFQDAASFLVYGTLPFLPPGFQFSAAEDTLHSGWMGTFSSRCLDNGTTGTN
jgi:hypothetical protein